MKSDESKDRKTMRSPRLRKWWRWAGGLLALYTLLGFFVLPPIVKKVAPRQLATLLHRQVAIEKVRINPYALSLTVRGLAVTGPDGRPFVSWDELYVNFQASSLFRWAWTFDEIRLVKPFGEVILLKDGRLNFSDMIDTTTNAPPKPNAPAAIPGVNIFRLEITNGFFALEDRTRRSVFRSEYRPINLLLRDFTTHPNRDTPYSFHAESDAGRSITWAGDLAVQPLRSSGHLEITGVRLPRFQPYLEDSTRALLTNGLGNAQLDYRLAAGTNGFGLVVTNADLQMANVEVRDPDSGETVASLRGFDVKRAGFNLRERAVRLGTVKVSEASVLTRLKPDGHFNLLELIMPSAPNTNAPSKPATTAAASPPWTFAVDEFTIEQTAVSFEDLTRRVPFRSELKPITVNVKGFTTRPDVDAQFDFHIASEAAETLEGSGTFSINPLRSSGEVKVAAIDVKKYLPYVDKFFRGKIVAGKLATSVPYRVALADGKLDGSVTNLSVSLTELDVQLPENAETVTRIKQIGIESVDASLAERSGRVGLFKGEGGAFVVRRQKDGALNLLGLLAASRTNAPPAPGPSSDSTNRAAVALGGWTLNVDEIRLDDYSVKFEDHGPSKPAVFLLHQLGLNVKGVSTETNRAITANAKFRLNETGTIAARGTAMLAPLAAELDVAVTNLDLHPAQPYLDPFVALDIASGALNGTVKARFQTNDAAAPRLTFSGGLSLTNLVTTDQVAFKEFVRWDYLSVSGIDIALTPNHFNFNEVRFVRPQAGLRMGADHQSNFSSIFRKSAAGTNASVITRTGDTAATAGTQSLLVQLGALALENASFAFTDESVEPAVALTIEELSGTLKGLTSSQTTPAEVNLAGKLDAQSPFSIAGRVNPFPATRFVDLTITNANTQLTPLTGYLEKYGGYPLRKGRLSTSLRYRVEGATLNAENKIQVDQFTLGPHNNSPDATKLPLKLGIALLKDANGRIELDVPVKGRLDDPEFRPGPIILKVVLNMIVKAAASPFNLLGSLIGVGGGEEFNYIEFQPGTANLLEGETNKLTQLTTALAKRPTLNLEIEGEVDPVLDREALAKLKLADQLKAKRLQELSSKGRAPELVAKFQTEPEERERLLRAAFVEQFGTNISEIIQTNLSRLTATNQPPPTAARAAPKPKRSLLQRVAGVFGGGSGGGTRTEKRLPKADREALELATPELMETLLAEKIEVAGEEFNQLATARARWVQDWLAQHGQIAADRLFIIAPKPVNASSGESHVNLSVN